MSILNCPVCQAAMRELTKGGVVIDTCTQCRGVWLDRGELEKLIGMMDRDDPDRPVSRALERGRSDDRGRQARDWDDDDDRDHRSRDGGPPPSRMSRLFDFFD
jgi:uncharacterized protein